MAEKKSHFTPEFLAAFAPVKALMDEAAEAGAGPKDELTIRYQTAFRDAMLKLGHKQRIKNLYRVKSKLLKKAIFFKLNAPQEMFMDTRKGRDVILKIRQVGFTTLSGVRGLDLALWEPNTSTGIMAHQKDVVVTIFEDIVKFTYDWYLKDWGHLYRPVENSDSKTELSFKTDGLGRDMHSSMRVLFDFRGKTVHFLHVSEAARVDKDRLVGSLNGVPANGEAILESTPQGRSGEFYRLWQVHKKNGSLAPYKGFFIPWYIFYPEDPSQWSLPSDVQLTAHEQMLMRELNLSEAHIAWRRWSIEANCEGKTEVFDNEYPTNDIDCFLTGEAQVFPVSLLKKIDSRCRPPTKRVFLMNDGRRIIEEENDQGTVAIWESPQPQSQYVIGGDPSSGVGKDRGAAVVKNRNNKNIVAYIAGQLSPDDFALELYKLGRFYNNAWICPEENNHGHVVIQSLKRLQYPHVYRRVVIDEITDKPTKKLGFLTTNDSKIRITEQMKKAAKNGDLNIFQSEILDEMTSFVQLASKNGFTIRREATDGAHDDLVIATALAEEMDVSLGALVDDEVGDDELEEAQVDEETGFLRFG